MGKYTRHVLLGMAGLSKKYFFFLPLHAGCSCKLGVLEMHQTTQIPDRVSPIASCCLLHFLPFLLALDALSGAGSCTALADFPAHDAAGMCTAVLCISQQNKDVCFNVLLVLQQFQFNSLTPNPVPKYLPPPLQRSLWPDGGLMCILGVTGLELGQK